MVSTQQKYETRILVGRKTRNKLEKQKWVKAITWNVILILKRYTFNTIAYFPQ